jgi:hypothetical protein
MIALVALLVFPAAGLLAWGVITVSTYRRKPALEKTLAPYTVGYSRESNAAPSVYGDHEFVRSPILQRAIDAVAEVAARRGLMAGVEAKIDQADIPVRPAEALFLYLVVTVLGGLLVLLVGNVFWGVGVFVALAILPWVAANAFICLTVARHAPAARSNPAFGFLDPAGSGHRGGPAPGPHG